MKFKLLCPEKHIYNPMAGLKRVFMPLTPFWGDIPYNTYQAQGIVQVQGWETILHKQNLNWQQWL